MRSTAMASKPGSMMLGGMGHGHDDFLGYDDGASSFGCSPNLISRNDRSPMG